MAPPAVIRTGARVAQRTPEGQMDKQLEMTQELRKARNWIIIVGLLMFVVDMFVVFVIYGDRLSFEVRNRVVIFDLIILGYFVAMWLLAKYKPVIACVLALCGFWGLHIYLASVDGTSIFQGIVIKILFTLALIRGIKSANRAEQLKRELEHVFG